MCFHRWRCPKTENPAPHLPRHSALPEFSSPHLPYHRLGPLLWTFTLKTRRLFSYPSPPCCHYSSNPPGARGKNRLLTFHITDLDHFCRNLPSKFGLFFTPLRPHFDAMPAVSSLPEKTSPHIPYHRVGTILWTFNLKNRHVFWEPRSPLPLSSVAPFRLWDENVPLIFHITELEHIYSHLPSKFDSFFGGVAPHAAADPNRGEKHPLTFHITESDHFLGHFTSKIGVPKMGCAPLCGIICGGIHPTPPQPALPARQMSAKTAINYCNSS